MVRLILAVLAAATMSIAFPGAPAHAEPAGVIATEVSFSAADGVVLHGTVLAPASASAGERRPAMVMVHGAGNRGRQERRPEAEAFARRGIVTLVYDKRTEGYSLLHRDYGVLADDALAGLRLLRSRADVDPARLGLWALSEGAFVAPLAASRSTDVRFLITVGAIGTTPARQTAWAYGEFLGHAGVAGSLRHTMQVTAVRLAVNAGLFPEADFDPVPGWQQVRQPVLAQWGEFDRQAAPRESSRLIADALRRGGNTHYTLRFVPAVRHDLNLTADGGFDRTGGLSPSYGEFEAAWINGGSASPAVVRSAVATDRPSVPLPAPAWYDSPWWQLAAAALLLLAFGGYPLTAAARRFVNRGSRRKAVPAAAVLRPARWLAATGLATITGLLFYLFFMLATYSNLIGPVVFGRPVPWLILQILAIATVATTIATVLAWRRRNHELGRSGRARLALLVTGGAVFLPLALYWGLLVP